MKITSCLRSILIMSHKQSNLNEAIYSNKSKNDIWINFIKD